MQAIACGVYDCVRKLIVVSVIFFILLPSDGLLYSTNFRYNAANDLWSLWLCKDTYCDEHALLHTTTFRWSASYSYLQIMLPITCRVYDCIRTLIVMNLIFFAPLPSDPMQPITCGAYDWVRTIYCDEPDLFRTSTFRSNAANGLWSLWLCKDTHSDEHCLLPTATFRDSPEVTLCCWLVFGQLLPSGPLRPMAFPVYDCVTRVYFHGQELEFCLLLLFSSNAANGVSSLGLCTDTYCDEHVWSSHFYLQIKCSQ